MCFSRFLVGAVVVAFVGAFAAPVLAQKRLLAEYVVDLGPEDYFTSTGVRHTTFTGLLAQDRANYHRFGIRHQHDGEDPIFAARAMRAQIGPDVLEVEPYYRQFIQNLLNTRNPRGSYFVVSVYGQGSTITRISIVVPG